MGARLCNEGWEFGRRLGLLDDAGDYLEQWRRHRVRGFRRREGSSQKVCPSTRVGIG